MVVILGIMAVINAVWEAETFVSSQIGGCHLDSMYGFLPIVLGAISSQIDWLIACGHPAFQLPM